MVRLKLISFLDIVKFIICLNSTMVRLKRFSNKSSFSDFSSLNSTMVRLKLYGLQEDIQEDMVSIPLWFD